MSVLMSLKKYLIRFVTLNVIRYIWNIRVGPDWWVTCYFVFEFGLNCYVNLEALYGPLTCHPINRARHSLDMCVQCGYFILIMSWLHIVDQTSISQTILMLGKIMLVETHNAFHGFLYIHPLIVTHCERFRRKNRYAVLTRPSHHVITTKQPPHF